MENQPMQPIQSMEPKGKTILKVVGILLIIGAGLSIILTLIAMATIPALLMLGGLGIIAILALLLSLVMGALQLVAGIMGVKYCDDVSKAKTVVVFGGILIGIAALNLILALVSNEFSFSNITSLVLPALFLYGGLQNQKSPM